MVETRLEGVSSVCTFPPSLDFPMVENLKEQRVTYVFYEVVSFLTKEK